MNSTIRCLFLIAILLVARGAAGQDAHKNASKKIMPFTSIQLDEMRQKHIATCNAASFGNATYSDACEQIYLGMISRWQEKYSDPKVSPKIWNDCYESSGAKFSHDVVGWVQCIIRTQYR